MNDEVQQRGLPRRTGTWLPANAGSFTEPATASAAPPSSPGAPATSGSPMSSNTPLSPSSSAVPAAPPERLRSTTSPFRGILAAVLVAGTVGGVAGSALTAATFARNAAGTFAGPQVPAASAAPAVSQHAAIADGSLNAIYKQVSPAVVSVETSVAASNPGARQRSPFAPGFQGAPGNGQGSGQGSQGSSGSPDLLPSGEGTGFVVDGDGHVLTNNHVVAGSSRVTVVLADGTRLPAGVVGTDPGSDLALLKTNFPPGKVSIATLGDSDAVQPGDEAIAIGTPFGLDHTITAGIISAVNRDFGTAAGRPMHGLIQTDAAINPGNSGGPLLNAAGEVIGITTSIESPVRANVGVGFAIPSNAAKRLLPSLLAGKTVQHAWLGISGVAAADATAGGATLPGGVTQGVVVAQVVPNSPAAQAGLAGGDASAASPAGAAQGADIIVAVDGKPIQRVQDLSGYLDTKQPGDVVTLTIVRNGARQDLRVTLAPWPASQES